MDRVRASSSVLLWIVIVLSYPAAGHQPKSLFSVPLTKGRALAGSARLTVRVHRRCMLQRARRQSPTARLCGARRPCRRHSGRQCGGMPPWIHCRNSLSKCLSDCQITVGHRRNTVGYCRSYLKTVGLSDWGLGLRSALRAQELPARSLAVGRTLLPAHAWCRASASPAASFAASSRLASSRLRSTHPSSSITTVRRPMRCTARPARSEVGP